MEEREKCLNTVLLECVTLHNQRKEQELTSKMSETIAFCEDLNHDPSQVVMM